MPETEKYCYIRDPEAAWVEMVIRKSDISKVGTVWQFAERQWQASPSDWYRGRKPTDVTYHPSKKAASTFLDALGRAYRAEYTPGQKLFWILADGQRRGGVVESRLGDTLIVTQGSEGTPGVRISMADVAREMRSAASVNGGLPIFLSDEGGPRYLLIPIADNMRAVVDSGTGAFYGVAERDGRIWGARDWEGLSLPSGFTEQRESRGWASFEFWADMLIERADRKGLPTPADPGYARGMEGGFLFMPSMPVEEHDALHAYTPEGRHLGMVYRDPHGRWQATRRAPGSFTDVVHIGTADSRTEAAQRLHDAPYQEA
jgi:hypothetical protein